MARGARGGGDSQSIFVSSSFCGMRGMTSMFPRVTVRERLSAYSCATAEALPSLLAASTMMMEGRSICPWPPVSPVFPACRFTPSPCPESGDRGCEGSSEGRRGEASRLVCSTRRLCRRCCPAWHVCLWSDPSFAQTCGQRLLWSARIVRTAHTARVRASTRRVAVVATIVICVCFFSPIPPPPVECSFKLFPTQEI